MWLTAKKASLIYYETDSEIIEENDQIENANKGHR